jgi:hypothetical protein
MHFFALLASALLLTTPTFAQSADSQSAASDRGGAQETQVNGYWIDPSTGLMWAAKDNGKDVSWHKAMKYCRDLRLAGYSDWRLATLDELQGVYDRRLDPSGMIGKEKGWEFPDRVKGNIYLTGDQWSSSRINDDRGHPSGYAWRFDFNEGRPFSGDELWFYTNKRALCVRGSGK